jgi:hypothetical protein
MKLPTLTKNLLGQDKFFCQVINFAAYFAEDIINLDSSPY